MELLLLLSAFFTALTGAITGVRPVQGVAAHQQVVAGPAALTVRRATPAPAFPVSAWPPAPRTATALKTLVLTPVEPPFGLRRRE